MRHLEPFQGWRLTFFQGVMFAVFILFSVRLYQLQVIEHDNAQIAADENRLSGLPIPANRGVIFDRYGTVLAGNSPAFNITIIPAELPDDEDLVLDIYNRLSALTDVPPTRALADEAGVNIRSIEEIVFIGESIRPFTPVTIATDVPRSVALLIREESYEMPGVGIQVIGVREYPYGDLMSHIIGYMGPVGQEEALELINLGYDPRSFRVGYDGLEASMEDILAGIRGSELREVDVAGEIIQVLDVVQSQPGQNIQLTIDADLQEAAQQALIDRINFINTTASSPRQQTQTGVVIAMDPTTGEILALVSYPSYDNSRFAREIDAEYYLQVLNDPLTPLVNHAIGSVYPPGSAWKLITAAAVLEENVIAPETPLFDPGDFLVANYYAPNDRAADQRFVCWNREGHQWQDIRGAIAQSCNVYFYQVGGGNPERSESVLRRGGLGIENLVRYATALGIGSYTGAELFGEVPTRMPDPDWKRRVYGESWSTGDTYNAAFGQGYINVTPLQLINSVAAIVNDGTLYQPTLIREYLDGEGGVLTPFTPQIQRTLNLDLVSPDEPMTLHLLEDMIIQGENSLACSCEPFSGIFNDPNPYYNPNRCNPEGYTATADLNPDDTLVEQRDYNVLVPEFFNFNFTSICDARRFDSSYTPAFISSENMQIVREGMRQTVTIGTGGGANLPFVEVAGKTGTAEYCDNIAFPLGLCIQGNWPSHAWFTGYAPYNDPEILVVAFVYNGSEGSGNALPIAVEVLEAYFRLQSERGTLDPNINLNATAVPDVIPPTPVPAATP